MNIASSSKQSLRQSVSVGDRQIGGQNAASTGDREDEQRKEISGGKKRSKNHRPPRGIARQKKMRMGQEVKSAVEQRGREGSEGDPAGKNVIHRAEQM